MRWKPIDENPEAEEDAPGVLIVRIRENLDFGALLSGHVFSRSGGLTDAFPLPSSQRTPRS